MEGVCTKARRQCTGTGRFCDDFGRKLEVLSALVTKQRFAATDGSKNPRRAMEGSSGDARIDENGIDVDAVKQIKEVERKRIKEYLNYHPDATYGEGSVWDNVICDVALPCATQNEINKVEAQRLADSGCYAVCEGANMPTNAEATEVFLDRDILFLPGKASNAGGVATSALEMGQNSIRSSWTFDEVDAKLKGIMINIYYHMKEACEQFDAKDNFVAGANIAGFMKVADAMMAQGIV